MSYCPVVSPELGMSAVIWGNAGVETIENVIEDTATESDGSRKIAQYNVEGRTLGYELRYTPEPEGGAKALECTTLSGTLPIDL